MLPPKAVHHLKPGRNIHLSNDAGAGLPTPRTQAVDSLNFRLSNPLATGTSGAGFYFKDVVVSNSPPV